MTCEAWGSIDHWCAFIGVLIAALAALPFIFNGTPTWGQFLGSFSVRVFRDLMNRERETRRALERGKPSPLLASSSVVAAQKESWLRGALWTIALMSKSDVYWHAQLRRHLELVPHDLRNEQGLLSPSRILNSKAEIDEAVADMIENPPLLKSGVASWSFALLIFGIAATIVGSFPICV